MQQTRLNWCIILYIHNEETDKLDLIAVANNFVSRNPSCRSDDNSYNFCMDIMIIFLKTRRIINNSGVTTFQYIKPSK